MFFLRQSLGRASRWDAINHLNDLVGTGALKPEQVRELMHTPRMRKLLGADYAGVENLRKLAKWKPLRQRARKRKKLGRTT